MQQKCNPEEMSQEDLEAEVRELRALIESLRLGGDELLYPSGEATVRQVSHERSGKASNAGNARQAQGRLAWAGR